MTRLRPSQLRDWPVAFDPRTELDWGRADYGRRLLREHLDQSHDGASRRLPTIARHVRRLQRLLPPTPARVLDVACGPGFYAVPLAAAGHQVTGIDVSAAAIRHARRLARGRRLAGSCRFEVGDVRDLETPAQPYDAALLVYYLLEAFPRVEQPRVLRAVARCLRPGGLLVAELRLQPDQPPGRIAWWEVVPRSVLGDRRHLLLGDTTWDARRRLYVLREVAVFDDGRVAAQQTSAWMCPFEALPGLFARAGLELVSLFDGWSSRRGTQLSESLLVLARRRG